MAVTPKRCKVNFATMFGSDLSEIHLFLDGVSAFIFIHMHYGNML